MAFLLLFDSFFPVFKWLPLWLVKSLISHFESAKSDKIMQDFEIHMPKCVVGGPLATNETCLYNLTLSREILSANYKKIKTLEVPATI